ncbi:MAG: hypothetical protein UY48_C0003G0060 [Candidatus Gottesmanbacteria bacterium GW2011_GWB1_49_7]|uniref:Uncharacterized protein n=1 Tax=Candidatus Gottesmanbacteria bacterium GW2011_GWB1_49_7 TaxID=1618448 RepID=A0A0G1W3G0_9BACT|nr:MAG: hypothetical protein UY48_C0003G0060 [Candidatus Gottesmanbacteria bacterium GW2011_GWB1_49_7]
MDRFFVKELDKWPGPGTIYRICERQGTMILAVIPTTDYDDKSLAECVATKMNREATG